MLDAAVADTLAGERNPRLVRGSLLTAPVVVAIPAAALFEPLLVLVAVPSALFLVGYVGSVFSTPLAAATVPPLTDWTNLLRTGVVATTIWIGLVAVPTLAIGAILTFEIAGNPLAPQSAFWLDVSVVGFVFVVGSYVTPAVVLARLSPDLATDRSTVRTARSVATSRAYVVASLQAVLIAVTAGGVAIMLLVTVFGLVFVPTAVFLAVTVIARRYAYAAVAAVDPALYATLEEPSLSWF